MSKQKQKIDWDVVDIIARRRKRSHDGTRKQRDDIVNGQDKLNMDRVGAAAEVAFSQQYDLPSPSVKDIVGDGGYDFKVVWNGKTQKVEIKSSDHNNPNLMVPSLRDIKRPDKYVLYKSAYREQVTPLGWIDTEVFVNQAEKKDSKFGDYCLFLHSKNLNEMPTAEVIESLPKTKTNKE